MGSMQRTKGATFERKIASELQDRLGMKFSRNLAQYQEAGLGDLNCDEDAFPFMIECKHHSTAAIPAWWKQTHDAAFGTVKKPALIYRITGRKVRVVITARAIVECLSRGQWSGKDHLVEMDLDAFAYVAREGLLGGASKEAGTGV